MRIQKLDPSTREKIAAGEILERPSSLVKELIENSLDAGATRIEIFMDHGGRTLRITDNGRGIHPEDLSLALQRHTTSKIKKAEDLFSLSSYGFRGEALASAAAVSKMRVTSRHEQANQAMCVQAAFSEIGTLSESSHSQGTTLEISQLFENVPARLKFLKSDSAEISQIRKVVRAFALLSPHVHFTVKTASGALEIYSPENPLIRAATILKVSKVYEATWEDPDWNCKVYFTAPQEVQKTSQNIWVFIQGRWVTDRALQSAILEAYRSLLMHHEYPSIVLQLNCPPDQIDVNVHPAKTQVKFQNPGKAFQTVYHTLRPKLEEAPWAPHSPRNPNEVPEKASGTLFKASESTHQIQFDNSEFQKTVLSQKQIFNEALSEDTSGLTRPSPAFESSLPLASSEIKNNSSDTVTQKKTDSLPFEISGSESFTTPQPRWTRLQVLGQAHQTYVLTQSDNALILIDQHAAHERVLFERFLKQVRFSKPEIQQFLIPLTISFENENLSLHEKIYQDSLGRLGLEIDILSPQELVVRQAPVFLTDSAIQKTVELLVKEVEQWGASFAFEKVLSHLVATAACHSAIRAGQALSSQQMKELLEQMDEFPLSGFCPHGRPVHQEITFEELEKRFGRRV